MTDMHGFHLGLQPRGGDEWVVYGGDPGEFAVVTGDPDAVATNLRLVSHPQGVLDAGIDALVSQVEVPEEVARPADEEVQALPVVDQRWLRQAVMLEKRRRTVEWVTSQALVARGVAEETGMSFRRLPDDFGSTNRYV